MRLPFVLIFLLLAGCGNNAGWHSKPVAGLLPDLQFTLVNDRGQAVTAQDYLGKTSVMFFGYTHCPDVCPLTLGKLRLALKQLDAAQQAAIQVLFVSVDPARDDLFQLQQYTASFGPAFSGLTGSQPQLETVTRRFRTTFSYGERDAQGNYPVSHSSAAFVFDPQGQARLLIREESAEEIAEDLQRLLENTRA